MAPKSKGSDAGNSVCQREAVSAFVKWKGRSSQFQKEKQSYAEAAKIYSKNKSSVHKIV